MFDRETNGRIAKAEISLFDAIHAEILEHRMAEKLAHEKHRAGKQYRHRKPDDRHSKLDRISMQVHGFDCGNDTARIFSREKYLRQDWEREQDNIAEYAMWEKYNAEIQQERMRNLNEWLKYA